MKKGVLGFCTTAIGFAVGAAGMSYMKNKTIAAKTKNHYDY